MAHDFRKPIDGDERLFSPLSAGERKAIAVHVVKKACGALGGRKGRRSMKLRRSMDAMFKTRGTHDPVHGTKPAA